MKDMNLGYWELSVMPQGVPSLWQLGLKGEVSSEFAKLYLWMASLFLNP